MELLVRGWFFEVLREILIRTEPARLSPKHFQDRGRVRVSSADFVGDFPEEIILNDPESLPFTHLQLRTKSWILSKPLSVLFRTGIPRLSIPRKLAMKINNGISKFSVARNSAMESRKGSPRLFLSRQSKTKSNSGGGRLSLPPELTMKIIEGIPDRPISWLSDAVDIDVVRLHDSLQLPVFSLVPMNKEQQARTIKALATILETFRSVSESNSLEPIQATRLISWRLSHPADRREMYTVLNWFKQRMAIRAHDLQNLAYEGAGVAVFLTEVPQSEDGQDLELCWVHFRCASRDLIVKGVPSRCFSVWQWFYQPRADRYTLHTNIDAALGLMGQRLLSNDSDFKAVEYQYDPKQTFPPTPDRDESPRHIYGSEWIPVIFTDRLPFEAATLVIDELQMRHATDSDFSVLVSPTDDNPLFQTTRSHLDVGLAQDGKFFRVFHYKDLCRHAEDLNHQRLKAIQQCYDFFPRCKTLIFVSSFSADSPCLVTVGTKTKDVILCCKVPARAATAWRLHAEALDAEIQSHGATIGDEDVKALLRRFGIQDEGVHRFFWLNSQQ